MKLPAAKTLGVAALGAVFAASGAGAAHAALPDAGPVLDTAGRTLPAERLSAAVPGGGALGRARPVAERGPATAKPVAERGLAATGPVAERGLATAEPVAERLLEDGLAAPVDRLLGGLPVQGLPMRGVGVNGLPVGN
ncbi:ATP-binding protein [Streptomyces echinoruber]|uniref:ATP-binding protein n=1 Tax=Streptomyces echinoruber TaxID=68898 RepID=A0A918VKH1_9ACTN|nr:ATP-binding protein [Streptomyces echinoruber]GHA08755.1 hypothetical protein GCM10010389_54870 [Streptomyces echinoruber]